MNYPIDIQDEMLSHKMRKQKVGLIVSLEECVGVRGEQLVTCSM